MACEHIDCSFDDEDVFQMESVKRLRDDPRCQLFRFKQNKKCYCFCVADLYRWIYGSLDLNEDVKIQANPKTREVIKPPTLERLKREYESYYMKFKTSDDDITDRERQEFNEGVDQFKAAFEVGRHGVAMRRDQAMKMYMDDLEIILSDDEYKRQKRIMESIR